MQGSRPPRGGHDDSQHDERDHDREADGVRQQPPGERQAGVAAEAVSEDRDQRSRIVEAPVGTQWSLGVFGFRTPIPGCEDFSDA
jgi:hypothetical protein